MTLPWVRLDANCYSHDKTLWLLAQRDGHRGWAVYTFALAYAGGHGTDGLIPRHVLPAIHGTERIARLLADAGLWDPDPAGWRIRNWDQRQALAADTEARRRAARSGGRKRACQRYHDPGCGCWQDPDPQSPP